MRFNHTNRRHRRCLTLSVGSLLVLAACGGSEEASTPADDDSDSAVIADEPVTSDLDTSELDTSELDEGQQEILDDVIDDGFADDGPSPVLGLRLVRPLGVDTITDAFPDELAFPDVDVVGFPDNHQAGKSSALAGDGVWVVTSDTLHRFVIADGTESASVAIGEVLPGDDQAEFVGVDGDETGIFALVNGFDITLIVEIDPASGAVVATHDVTTTGLRGTQLAAGPTHVAVANNGSTPVKLLDRSSAVITDVGTSDRSKGVAVTSDRLAISNSASTASGAFTYDVHSLADGSLITSGELPYGDIALRVHGDRILQQDVGNDPQPLFEIDPQGTPAADFLPDEVVQITDWVETDGVIYVITNCCVIDEFGNGLSTIALDAATGDLLGGDQARGTHIALP